ncbi:MAG: replication-associated recombination protein A [Lachnospiraceae bacterium]|nr:replication-associated recombination protein A [Lachnospiraceae bacterium]
MDLFDYMSEKNKESESPLAARMRPRTPDEIVGQEDIIAPGKLLYRAIMADKISSLILYGPPGTGKTTIAKVIAGATRSRFISINATTAGKKDMEDAVNEAKSILAMNSQKTILFIDEIHRFNKGQQDFLLPFVEDGTVTLIGATTENPYFEVNGALISRSMIFELKPLSIENIITLLKTAVTDEERGMAVYNPYIDDAAVRFIADVSGGDARHALNALELAILTTEPDEEPYEKIHGSAGHDADDEKKAAGDTVTGPADPSKPGIHIRLEEAQECIQRKAVRYDKTGDNHYDTISAFIKSMRGSDPDAAVYYLARMLDAGEEVSFIARRIVICAAEDVGMADPQALVVANAAFEAVIKVGMPEARIILSEAAIYVATAPKSNSAICAVDDALEEVRTSGSLPIPPHLQDAHYKGAAKLGHGTGYMYAHDYPDHYVKQQYLPYELDGREFFRPDGQGYENKIKEHFKKIKGKEK